MAGSEINITETSRVFTLSEAFEHMRILDRQPSNRNIKWKDVRTGNIVSIASLNPKM